MFADFDRIAVDDTRSLTRTITEDDVRRFVEMTGDDNPLHVDRRFAETTSFHDIVVHGMLGASFISTVIGTQLPGPGALWVSQSLDFLLPVRLGDVLTVTCTVLAKHERERLLELDTVILNQNRQKVLTGGGKVKLLEATAPVAAQAKDARPGTAIVTGGGGGIGSAIARRLAADGFAVVVNYMGRRDKAEQVVAQIADAGGRALAVQADVATDAGVAALHEQAARAFGPVGVVVNNASPRIQPRPLADSDWTEFQRHLDIQVRGALQLIQACVPAMTEAKWGRIVNITSQEIAGPPTAGWTAYAVAKSGLATLTRYLAAELGPTGITVNAVSPGMTQTAMIGDVSQKLQMMLARQTPLRRLAVPEDVAGAVGYLVSDDAAYVTGHALAVSGGTAI